MCGISGVELLVIVAAAIIILGPDKLPELMRVAGRLARDVRRLRGDLGEVTRDIRSQVKVDDLTKDLGVDRVRERMKEAESEIDQIRARLNRKVDVKTLSDGISDQTIEGGLAALPEASSTESEDAAWAPDGPAEDATERIVVRPSPGSVAQTPSTASGAPTPQTDDPDPAEPESAQPTPATGAAAPSPVPAETPPPVHRIRSNAFGAPELVPVMGDEAEGEEAPE